MRKHTHNRFAALMLVGVLCLPAYGIPTFAEQADRLPDAPGFEPSADLHSEDGPMVVGPDFAGADGEIEDDPLLDAQAVGNTALPADEIKDPAQAPSSGPLKAALTLIAFDPLSADVAEQKVTVGTVLGDLVLPQVLAAAAADGHGDRTVIDVPVEQWQAVPAYDSMAVGTYRFTPVLAPGYTLEGDALLPDIAVQIVWSISPATAQTAITSYAELSAQLAGYPSATEDMEIVLAPDFPVDAMAGTFAIQGNTGGYTLTIRSADSVTPATLTRGAAAAGHLFQVNSGAHLILQDVVIDGGKESGVTASGSLVNVNGGTLTMRTGALLQSNNDTSRWGSGGGVSVYNGGTFTMEDGLIAGNTVTDRGGGVYVSSTNRTTSTFTMEGGRIIDNTAHGEGGGGVHVNVTFTNCFGAFILKDGTIAGNRTTNKNNGHGGGVYVGGANTSMVMEGGEISGNMSEGLGGGVYVSTTLFTMKDGIITGNESVGSSGGGVSVGGRGSRFIMEKGQIVGNTARVGGGGVRSSNSDGFLMEDGLIAGNRANSGGGVSLANTPFTMQGGQITQNTAIYHGGGIQDSGSGYNFTLEDGEISHNTAQQNGGGVYLSNKTATIRDGKIFGNTASEHGGGVFIERSSRLTVENGRISENTADHGGGVYIDNSASFTMEGGLISHNTAGEGNGVFVSNTANSFTMNGGLIFGRGMGETSVVRPATWQPDAAGDGVVIRWSGNDGDVYLYGDDEHLHLLPTGGAEATWTIDSGRHGVAYLRHANAGFVELPVAVRHPVTVSISGTFRYDETLFAPTDLPDPPTGGWGTLTHQWTRNGVAIPGATGSGYVQRVDDIGNVINVTVVAEHGYAPVSSANTVPTAKALQPAPPAFALEYTYDRQTHTYVVAIPDMVGGEYSFDQVNYHATRTTTASPGDTVTGALRYAETPTHEVSPTTESRVTLPILVTSIAVTGEDGRSHIAAKGGTLQMLADVRPPEASQSVIWTVAPGSAAAIDVAGLLTAATDGVVVVRATAVDGSGVYGEMQVVVSGQTGGGDAGVTPNPNAYTVTYHANGGQGRVPIPTSVRQGLSYTIVEPALVKTDGERFVQWNTDLDGGGTGYAPGQIITMPGHDLILYAIWEDIDFDRSYTVTFHANGGAVFPGLMQTDADGKLAYLPTPARSGSYRFAGWYTGLTGGVQITADHVFGVDITLYARWRYTGSGGGGDSGDADEKGTAHIPDPIIPSAPDTPRTLDSLSIIVHVHDVFTLPAGIAGESDSAGWHWDATYLSVHFGDTVTFTARKVGTTTITYTDMAANRGVVTITILPAEETLVDIPDTGNPAKRNPQMGVMTLAHAGCKRHGHGGPVSTFLQMLLRHR